MHFVLEYEREMTSTIRRDIQADLYQATGPEQDQIEFLRNGVPVFVVRRSSVVTIERGQNEPQPEQRAAAGPVEAAARVSALSPAEVAHAVGAR